MVAPMLTAIVLFITVGGVAVLRPISKRIGDLLELYARDRQQGMQNELGQVRDLLETLDARLHLIEERQDFTDRLLAPAPEGIKRPRLPDDAGA
jgi:hypothetical protein